MPRKTAAKSTTGKANTKRPAAKTGKPRASGGVNKPAAKSAAKTPAKAPRPMAKASAGPSRSSGRKPLTIKPPIRKPAPSVAIGKADVNGSAAAAGRKPTRATTTASDKANLKNKKPRSVAEAASEHKADAKGYVFINGRRVRMISTKGAVPVKKTRSAVANAGPTEAEEQQRIRAIKTKLGRKELNEYRDLLLHKRRQLIGDLHAMEDQALRSGGGNLSHMPIHMADIGTDTFDQDFTLSLAENERKQLREIDGALQRIQDSTYGVCQMTGKPIPKARLDAKPWAKYTVESARIAEGLGSQ